MLEDDSESTAARRAGAYFPDHLILTASGDDADERIDRAKTAIYEESRQDINAPTLGLVSKEGQRLTGGYLGNRIIELCEIKYAQDRTTAKIRSRDGQEVIVWTDLYALVKLNELAHPYGVFADLSYAVSIGGAPWTPMGSPWAKMIPIGGPELPHDHPTLRSRLVAVDETGSTGSVKELIGLQWALQTGKGLELYDGSEISPAVAGERGSGVRVGIFDTSPWGEKAGSVTVDWVMPDLELEVMRVQRLEDPTLGWPPVTGEMCRSHGLAVAGLVHAVAPDAEIQLYPVLQENGVGDKYSTLLALDAFIRSSLSDQLEGLLRGAVINLSLGCHPPQDWWVRGLPGPCKGWWQEVGLKEEMLYEMLQTQPRGPVSLQTLLRAALDAGFVIISAAGNESAMLPAVADAQIPATYAECLAVSSCNARGELSCFSNWGQVAAPGGDGSPDCLPCDDIARFDPDRYLVVPIDEDNAKHALCAGTSFSAPLVSGLAALIMSRDAGRNISASQVSKIVIESARAMTRAARRPVAVRAAGLLSGETALNAGFSKEAMMGDGDGFPIKMAGIASIPASLEAFGSA